MAEQISSSGVCRIVGSRICDGTPDMNCRPSNLIICPLEARVARHVTKSEPFSIAREIRNKLPGLQRVFPDF